ncbi:MAG: arginine--tRNA ligase [Bacteroidetes bacterium]|nr:arginine--tRNA ligase [Bacteroidota bacterium]
MNIQELIKTGVVDAVEALYDHKVGLHQINVNITRKEFEGDYSVVVFPFTKVARKKPEMIGEEIGNYLKEKLPSIADFNVIKGFLNLKVDENIWINFIDSVLPQKNYGQQPSTGEKVVVEFASPNTNKPLHLGHIRNILLGWSCSKIQEAAGHEVKKVQIVNDRGIAICKSMLAWQKFGKGQTPESTGIKSDHFVGDYYVAFEKHFKEEYAAWQKTDVAQSIFEKESGDDQSQTAFFKGYKNRYLNNFSELGKEAKAMLINWEAGDEDTIALWKKMNAWVYAGFDTTYADMGVSFDKLYYESNTYLLGKDMIEKGLKEGTFYEKPDGSVWIDLESSGMDHKLVRRSDGTSVYITQDLGTAQLRYDDFGAKRMVYVVADEQNYHFKALFETLKKLKEPYAEGLYHLAYGMVDLPSGKMKSREGTVVDADDLIAEVKAEAKAAAKERGEIVDLTKEQKEANIRKIALAALKFFIIKVNPKRRMIFDPKESVDLQGQTGPYVQNAYVRIRSILRKMADWKEDVTVPPYENLASIERDLIIQVYTFPEIIQEAAEQYDPSTVANYCYNLAKTFHRFYHDYSIMKAETEGAKAFRLKLIKAIAVTLQNGMELLGIEMPERM